MGKSIWCRERVNYLILTLMVAKVVSRYLKQEQIGKNFVENTPLHNLVIFS